MQFLGVADAGPSVGLFLGNGYGVQPAQVAGVFGEGPAQGHGAGAALFQGRVVQEGVGHGVQNLVGKDRRLHRVPGVDLDFALFDGRQDFLVSLQVHRLGQAIADGLEHQGMVRRLDGLARRIVLALHLGGEHRRQQVVGAHPLQGRGDFAPAGVTEQGQEPGGVPPPACAEKRRLQHGLQQDFFHRAGRKVGEYVAHREGQVRPQGEVQAVVGGRRLQLEVESPANPLPQGHAPGPVDGRSEGGVDDELHPAAFVEKPFRHHPVARGDDAQYPLALDDIGHNLPRRLGADGGLAHQPFLGFRGVFQPFVHSLPQAGDFVRKLPGAARRFSQPERDGGRLTLGVLDPDLAVFDPANLPGGVAQQENVPAMLSMAKSSLTVPTKVSSGSAITS